MVKKVKLKEKRRLTMKKTIFDTGNPTKAKRFSNGLAKHTQKFIKTCK